MIQSQNDFKQSINMIEIEMSKLFNQLNDRNEKTLPNQLFTIPDFPNHIDKTQESWCLGSFNQDSFSSHHLEIY